MIARRLAILLCVVALVACENNEKNRTLLDRYADQATRLGQEALAPAPKKSYDPLTVSDKLWSGSKAVRLNRGIPLPGKFEHPRGVTLISSEPISLREIASSLGGQTGIPVRLLDGANEDIVAASRMPIAYEGPLSGLLDLVAGNYGVNWRNDGHSIKISRYETRIFVIESLPGKQTIRDGIAGTATDLNATSGSGGGGGTGDLTLQQSAEMSSEYKIWDEVQQALTAILGGVGTLVVSPSSGTATVTTTPEIMAAVSRFIEEENRRLTRQIAINIESFSVDLAENSDFSLSFEAVLKKLTNLGVSVSGVTGATATTGMGNISIAVLNPETVGQVTSIFSALSSVGDAARVAQFPLTTLNSRTVSRRVGRELRYVAEINSTLDGQGFSSNGVKVDTVREGFSIQLTPRLLEDGRIMMQYSLQFTELLNMEVFDTGGGGRVQLPETANRIFVQQAMLQSGSTLIIGGYDDEKVSQKSQGMFGAYNYIFGGGAINAKVRTMMFIAITPQVLEVLPRPEHG
ncbi:MAG: hypothetical protein FWF24_00690 [Alphaproteobacteria bacterium]|nr:hypothetical protein [Alphaproteobacteria bacterium]